MANLLELIGSVVTRDGDDSRQVGRVNEPFFLSIDGDAVVKRYTIAAATTKLLFDGSADEFATVSFLAIRVEQDSALELVFDTANTYGTRQQTYYLVGSGVAGEYGPLLIIPSAKAYANYTSPFAAGTLVSADKVRVKNLSSTTASKVELIYGE